MKYLGKIEDAKSFVTKEYVDEAISNIEGGSGGSYDDSELREELSKKADVDGVYPEMTVGMTRDMLGVGEGDEGEFLFRPTDGVGSIKDGFASIERIEGNSVVWNQNLLNNRTSISINGITLTNNGDGSITLNGTATAESWITTDIPDNKTIVRGHKWALVGCPSGGDLSTFSLMDGNGRIRDTGKGEIATIDATTFSPRIVVRSGVTCANLTFKPRLFDLTKMFGAGYEPLTLEEFYQRIPNVDLNAYNEGEIVDCKVQGIKSVGFNAWDEEYDFKGIVYGTGEVGPWNNRISSKNYIRIVSSAVYFLSSPIWLYVFFYDAGGKYISNTAGGIMNKEFTTPQNAYFIKFSAVQGEETTYNNDICIHLVHTGYRNGEYEPYKESKVALPILNYFPNGMRSIGSVCDEITRDKAIQRIGAVDLGDLDWTYEPSTGYFYSNHIKELKADSIYKAAVLNARYVSASWIDFVANYNGNREPMVAAYVGNANNNKRVFLLDSRYTDSASFKAAMSGVMLYYELAEPIVTSIDKPLALDYQVWDFGTEEAIAEGKTTPFKGSIIYEFNARDTIRKNKHDIATLNAEVLQLKNILQEATKNVEPYILNSTILDLDRAIQYYDGEQNISDIDEIRNALVNHRTIHIKYGSNFDGYFVVNGYIDGTDMITLEFWFGLTQYSIEIDTTSKIGYVSTYDA